MNFSQLLWGRGVSHSGGDPQVTGLDYNSRRIQPGWVFVAMRGESSDGNKYIDAALKHGAAAVVTDSVSELPRAGIPWAVVANGRRALARMSANFCGHPAEKLKVIGITGTNGKTTTTFLCESRPPRMAVINADDDYGRSLAQTRKGSGEEVTLYGIQNGDFRAAHIDLKQDGTAFELVTPTGSAKIETALIGGVNVYNILAAAAATFASGCPLKEIAEAIRCFKQVPGRFEKVDCGQPFTVVVDYAHTDDALRNLTAIARDFAKRSSGQARVITVFGCGGDRDRTKRPLMAEAAGQGSDFVVLTSDNPRSEDPQQIVADALPGLKKTSTRFEVEPDRKKAIGLALNEARAGDVVLIAGKGHEKVQITREGVFPSDDVQIVPEALQQMSYAKQGGAR